MKQLDLRPSRRALDFFRASARRSLAPAALMLAGTLVASGAAAQGVQGGGAQTGSQTGSQTGGSGQSNGGSPAGSSQSGGTQRVGGGGAGSAMGAGTAAASAGAGAVTAGQGNLYSASGTNGANPTNDSFRGSVVAGKSTGTTLPLTLDDAIARGLRQNLGVLLNDAAVGSAKGQRLEQLQPLLPTITAAASIEVEQVNLAAFGIKFKGVKSVVGPFQIVDFRAYLTQNVLNLSALQSYLATKHNFNAAKLTATDARDLVVLTVGNAYLLCVADEARIEAVNAELKTSKVTLDQATAGHDAGVTPRLDVLRAQVDFQNEQQNLISTTNQLAKDKIALARAIGLPLDQPFSLTDTAPYKPLDDADPAVLFEQALHNRKDLQAVSEQVHAAEALRKVAIADQYPIATISGDYGDIGTTPGHSHGTFTATGQVSAPVLQIAKTRGERDVAEATLSQARSRLADSAEQVNADLRSSLLDIQSAAKLVDATRSNVGLATEALSEAQLRFHEGISDNLPVSEAQTQVEQANDSYISALYQHNVAKLSLARALGVAETSFNQYLGGK